MFRQNQKINWNRGGWSLKLRQGASERVRKSLLEKRYNETIRWGNHSRGLIDWVENLREKVNHPENVPKIICRWRRPLKTECWPQKEVLISREKKEYSKRSIPKECLNDWHDQEVSRGYFWRNQCRPLSDQQAKYFFIYF